ncbi:MAG: DUF6788 family protein [bacterium]
MPRPRPSLEARIARIQQEITGLGADLQPGTLTQQYNVCGKVGCRCKAHPPQRHGPYYQLSFTRKGKSTTQFVKREDLPLVRQQVRNYRRLTKLLDRWIAWGMELSRLRLRQQRERGTKSPAESLISKGKRV